MATNKELQVKIVNLNERVARLQASNSELRDEMLVLKNNYTTLVKEVSERLEVIHNRFRAG